MNIDLINNSIKHYDIKKQNEIKEYVQKRIDENNIYEETHVHSKDQFEADNPVKLVSKRILENKQDAMYLTQYGVAAMTWAFKNEAHDNGLKFVPGVEAFYQDETLSYDNGLVKIDETKPVSQIVLHALNDDGWKAISMAISSSQSVDGKSYMSNETLKKHFGVGSFGHQNVVATTSGLKGILANILKEQTITEDIVKNIEETSKKKLGNYSDVHNNRLKEQIAQLKSELEESKVRLKAVRKEANAKFDKRIKLLEKIRENQGESSQAFIESYTSLSEDRAKAKQAEAEIPEITLKNKRLNARIKAKEKELNAFLSIKEAYNQTQLEVDGIRSKVVSSEVIENKVKEKLLELNSIFGKGYLFAEIQNHGHVDEAIIYPKIVKIARSLNIPLIATNDVHILDNSEDEVIKRQILKSTKDANNPVWINATKDEEELYFKSSSEIKNWLEKNHPEDVVMEAMLNTLVITCLVSMKFEHPNHHPKFIDETNRSSLDIFMDLINEGIKKKFPNGLDEEHQKRLDHEIHVMDSMGYVDYHLVVYDFNKYASEYDSIPFEKIPEAPVELDALKKWKKEKGYETVVGLTNGTGRGSAVGSLVCDLLGITHLDPMKYQLLFERFLNPERVTMPDIDSDISRTVRPIVIEYVKRKYGEDCVAGILTQNAQAPKGAIRIAAKAYGLYLHRNDANDNGAKRFLSLGDKMAKEVPKTPGVHFDSKMDEENPNSLTVYEHLCEQFSDENKHVETILKWAKNIEGCFTAYGAHAAGIVITDGTPVSEIVPTRWNKKLGMYTTQCDKKIAEKVGMLKFDMLGLKTIDIVNDALWEVNKTGKVIDTNNLPLDDSKVYSEIFAKGKTDSVFQFESQGMKQMLKRFQPENFEDLIILVSMFRPGPLQYLDDVIEVKHGRKPLTFLCSELESILGATYGAITYQEQVMQIFQQLAGYTLGGADLVRRSMASKDIETLNKERSAFVNGDASRNIVGCVANGISESAANELFTQMTEFAKYAFNKSHAAAYAYNAYITGYLKHHYPAEFMMAAMRWAEKQGDKDPIPSLMAEAKSLGIEVLPPNINHSGVNFTVDNGKILFGLGSVASVGGSSKEIVEERKKRKYEDFFNFFKRTNVPKDAVENLISAGAFDDFHDNRKAMLSILEDIKDIRKKQKDKEKTVYILETLLPICEDFDTDEGIVQKQKELGFRVEVKKVTTRAKLEKRIENAKKRIEELDEEYNQISFPKNIKENSDERLMAERKFIGAYVTSHPLDNYEDAEEMGIAPLKETNQNTKMIYGLISNVDIKNRKKDGKPMAFLTLEDKEASIKVNVWADSYTYMKDLIKVGAVVFINGYTRESEDTYSENEEESMSYVFTAQKITLAKKKQKGFLLTVSSMAVFHAFDEEDFISKYRDITGVPLKIYDKKLNELREMKYKVNPNVSSYPNVTKL